MLKTNNSSRQILWMWQFLFLSKNSVWIRNKRIYRTLNACGRTLKSCFSYAVWRSIHTQCGQPCLYFYLLFLYLRKTPTVTHPVCYIIIHYNEYKNILYYIYHRTKCVCKDLFFNYRDVKSHDAITIYRQCGSP